MNNSFYGREEQIQDLERLWTKKTSSLVSCRGRRRNADGYFDALIPFRKLLGV